GPGAARRAFFAPGRVNLLGGHLDYNGGPVLPTAIDRGTFIAVAPRSDGRVRLASTFSEAVYDRPLRELPSERTGAWYDYPLGVVAALRRGEPERSKPLDSRFMDLGFDVLFGGNLPVGAGLSSSASICVGTAYALDASFELGLDALQRVGAALHAEREFVGVHCGIMDPYAVGFARPRQVLWLDCKDESFEHLPLDFASVSIGVIDTGVQRALARGEFNRRVAECAAAFEALRPHVPGATVLRDIPLEVLEAHESELDPTIARRARHVIEEVARTFAARAALEKGDIETFGRSMAETHASLRDLYECSSEELDVIVDAALAVDGVHGARLTGAGFGGCVVAFASAGVERDVERVVGDAYENRYGRRPPVAFFQGDEGPREIT
ncbi:MAG: galactokinase, partial [Planctomycetota bacterium]